MHDGLLFVSCSNGGVVSNSQQTAFSPQVNIAGTCTYINSAVVVTTTSQTVTVSSGKTQLCFCSWQKAQL